MTSWVERNNIPPPSPTPRRRRFVPFQLSTLAELKGLATCTKLTMLSLLHNEVVSKQYYRLYMINLVPSLKQLDFQKVTVKVRGVSRIASERGRVGRTRGAGQ